MGDREELRGAIVNLLDNAVKFSGDHVDVEVDVRREGDRAVVRVRDQGPGLPPYEAKRIFRRFYRVPGPLPSASKAPASACSSSRARPSGTAGAPMR